MTPTPPVPADGLYRYYATNDAQGVVYEIHNGVIYGLMRSGHVRRCDTADPREFPGRWVRQVDEDEHWRDDLDYLYPSMPDLDGVDLFFDECGPPTGIP